MTLHEPAGQLDHAAMTQTGDFRACGILLAAWLLIFTIDVDRSFSGTQDAEADVTPPQIEVINQLIREQWKDAGLSPADEATDGEWCRRVFLDVIGRIPTVDELDVFLRDRGRGRKARLVKTLLYGQEYVNQYAQNWTSIWTNLLIGRAGGSERNSLVSREGMQQYLLDVFSRNQSYDGFVLDLVTAKGSNKPGSENFNGAVNFLAVKLGDQATQATAQTAKLFLGLQVQCTQCHNHPFNDWKQNQFWELNAFFRQAVALRKYQSTTGMLQFVELTDQDFAGESGAPEEADIFYELRNATLATAFPAFVDGQLLENRSGYVSDVNRREELGRMIVQSDHLPRAIVNRIWGHFLGYGFTNPLDDMGPHNPPCNPEMLEYLSREFAGHSYDLKQLITWIALSQPYSLSSRTTSGNEADDPALGESPRFSRFYLRQMRAEELYESLLVATGAQKTTASTEAQNTSKRDWLRQFSITLGTDEGDEATTFNGNITQALMLFNGDLIKRATSDDPGNKGNPRRIAESELTSRQKINRVFMATLARKPTGTELGVANRLLAYRDGDVAGALQDILWALLNSNEFILNH